MLKKYTCIVCPNGCDITVNVKDGKILSMEGEGCKRGQEYVEQELMNPQRNIASSVLLEGGTLPLVSVRLSNPVPKGKIFAVMSVIKKAHLKAPVSIGQVVIRNVLGLGSDVIVTKNVGIKR
jgi:CxxC motif-containing protein